MKQTTLGVCILSIFKLRSFHLHMKGIGCAVCISVVVILLCWFIHSLFHLICKGLGRAKMLGHNPLPGVDNEVMLFKNILSQ